MSGVTTTSEFCAIADALAKRSRASTQTGSAAHPADPTAFPDRGGAGPQLSVAAYPVYSESVEGSARAPSGIVSPAGRRSHVRYPQLEQEAPLAASGGIQGDSAATTLDCVGFRALPRRRAAPCRIRRPAVSKLTLLIEVGVRALAQLTVVLEERRLLTDVECKVLDCAAAGLTVDETAATRGVSRGTIMTQRRSVLRKIGAKNMTEAVAKGYELGLLGTWL
jgi:DNA-binding CsgD family transcriptional regulator